MKKVVFKLSTLFILVIIILLCSCGNQNKTNIKMSLKLSVADEASKAFPGFNMENEVDKTIEVLSKRIKELGCKDYKIEKSNDPLLLNVELKGVGDTSIVRTIIQTPARLGFWETYELSDVFVYFDKANKALVSLVKDEPTKEVVKDAPGGENLSELDSIMATDKKGVKEFTKENPLFSILSLALSQNEFGIQQPTKGPVVGYALISDTARINYLLNFDTIKYLFPRDFSLLWTVKAVDENKKMLQLIAIKTTRDKKAVIEGDVVVDASWKNGQSGNTEIMMEMNSEGARMWKRMTAYNINRAIAIVIDNYVYAFPTVMSEIEEGKSEISGNFSEQEAKTLAILIKGGAMPLNVEIVTEEVILNK